MRLLHHLTFLFLCLQAAAAGDFTINLQLQAGTRRQTVTSGRPSTAPFIAKAKETLKVQWTIVNGSAAALTDITLHVFMDRGLSANMPGPNAIYESALIADFGPGGKSSGEFRLPAPEAGAYFIRAETIGVAAKLGKEIYAAQRVSVP